MKISDNLHINTDVLKQCREQIGLSIEGVVDSSPIFKKIEKIESFERGEEKPTYKQLDELARLYGVPRWVFISDKLPEKYCYNTRPSFRKFKNNSVFDSKLAVLLSRVERLRDFLIELREDLDDPVEIFSRMDLKNKSPEEAAKMTRELLKLPQNEFLEFSELKERVEKQHVFVFLSSKYKGWSNIDKKVFRGLCVQHEKMPIIVINDSDYRKAQSFSLMHEFGHLLRGDTSIDDWHKNNTKEEKWCDEFAGKILLPRENIPKNIEFRDLSVVKKHARKFKISPWVLAVGLHREKIISQSSYDALEEQLQKEYEQSKKALKNRSGGPSRNRPLEVRAQFGNVFVNTLLTAWHNEKINLHKTMQILDLKRAAQVLEL